jgi:peptide/nickel transport system substrate-binding protein
MTSRGVQIRGAFLSAALLGVSVFVNACGGSNTSNTAAAACDPNATMTMADFTPAFTVDPMRTTGPGGDGTKYAVFDPLIGYIPGSGPGTGLQPALATAWKVVSPTLIDLTLRKNVTFHDGTPFNAAAVKTNLERGNNDPKVTAVPQSVASLIKNINVINEYDVQIELKVPQPGWIGNLTWGPGFMESPKAITGGANLDITAVGTGPFKLTKYTPQVGADYVRNDGYWNADFAKCAPKELHINNIPDPQAMYNGLSSGQLTLGYVAPASVPQAKSAGIKIINSTAPAAYSLYMNRGRPPFNNQAVRQALMYAIDRDALVKGVYHDLAKPAVQLFPTWDATTYNPGANYQPAHFAYNPTKAKDMLTQAGFPNGVSFTIDCVQGMQVDQDACVAMQQQAATAGFKINITQVPGPNNFYGGTGDAYYIASSGRPDDADAIDSNIGAGLLIPSKTGMPVDMQPLMADVRLQEFGSTKRTQDLQALSALITDDAWIVPVVYVDKVTGTSPCVINFKPSLQGAYRPVALQWKKGCKFP